MERQPWIGGTAFWPELMKSLTVLVSSDDREGPDVSERRNKPLKIKDVREGSCERKCSHLCHVGGRPVLELKLV